MGTAAAAAVEICDTGLDPQTRHSNFSVLTSLIHTSSQKHVQIFFPSGKQSVPWAFNLSSVECLKKTLGGSGFFFNTQDVPLTLQYHFTSRWRQPGELLRPPCRPLTPGTDLSDSAGLARRSRSAPVPHHTWRHTHREWNKTGELWVISTWFQLFPFFTWTLERK